MRRLLKIFFVSLLVLIRNTEGAAISLSTPYTQNFTTLSNSTAVTSWTDDSTVSGWYLSLSSYKGNDGTTGTVTAPTAYSFGIAATNPVTDRALGSVSFASSPVFYGVRFTNDTKSTITKLSISYAGEQWRDSNTKIAGLKFSYQIGATSLTSGVWTPETNLDFTNPKATSSGKLDGNASANRAVKSFILTGFSLANAQEIWLRWEDIDDSTASTHHALAIDDVKIEALGVIFDSTTLSLSEGVGTSTYQIKLNSVPSQDVTITPVVLDGQSTVFPSSLVFTVADASTFKTFTVTAADDSIDEGTHSGTISHTATSADTNYNNILIGNVTATITDNDTAGVTHSAMSGGVTEGGSSATYSIKLNTTPTNNVTVTITPDSQLTVAPSSLTFTPANALTNQTVTVNAVDDSLLENAHTGVLSHSVTSTDPKYNGITVGNVTVNITDNDTAGFTFSSNTISFAEGGAGNTYTIKLNTIPNANVTIIPTPDSQSTVSPSNLVFTSANALIPQTFTVTAVDDSIDEGTHSSTISHTVTSVDANYNNIPIGNLTATITDNDTAGVTVSTTSLNVAEGGATAMYDIWLNSEPTSNVTVTLAPGTQLSATPSSLTFTPTNALTPQTVTVSAVDNTFVDGTHSGTIIHSVISSDVKYNGQSVNHVTATISDNDSAGLTISPTSVNAMEGGASATYTIKLNTIPTQPVTVKFNTDAQIDSISDLTFAADATALTPQTVTVVAVDDPTTEGNHSSTITHTVTSSDSDYSGVGSASVTVNLTDNDSPGVTISTGTVNVAESGTTATYTMKLNTIPLNVVKISFNTGTQINPIANLVFQPDATALNPQTVTVSAIDDAIVEKAHSQIIAHSFTSDSDAQYKLLPINDVTANITDNDGAGITVSLHSLDLMEGRALGSYSIKLNTIPIAPVQISFHMNGQIYPISPITFQADATALNPQTVTVMVVDDKVYEPTQSATITHTATSGDNSYQGVDLSDQNVVVGIGDDDLPPSPPTPSTNPSNGGNNSSGGGTSSPSPSPPPDKASLFVQIDGSGQQGSHITLFPLPEGTCRGPQGQTCSVYKYSSEITITAVPASNAFFSGWGGSEECASPTSVTTVSLFSTQLCTAYFHLKPHKLTLSQAGEGHGQISTSLPGENLEHSDVECNNTCYPGGSKVKLIATPAGDSSFSGWSGDQDCQDGEVTLGEDKNCVANFVLLPTHALTWVVNGSGQVLPTVQGTSCGANCARYVEHTEVTLNATPAIGSTFTGWSGACSQEGKVTLDSDQTCTATFSLQPTFSLTVATVGNGTVNFQPGGEPCGQQCMTYLMGTSVALTATPAAGSTFSGWQGEGCGSGPVTVDKNRQCTAVFTSINEPPSTYKLMVSQVGTGKGQVTYHPIGAPCETGYVCYNKGTVVTLTAQSESGSHFIGWEGACSAQGQVVMDADKQCRATFNTLPILTITKMGEGQVTSSPAGIQCGETCRAQYGGGQVVSLTPAASMGSLFEKWGGDSDCEDGQISLDQDKQCIAVFKQVSRVQFSQSTYEAREDSPQVTFKVTRQGSAQGKISVVYTTTQGGTTTPQADYIPVTGKLTWEEGDMTDKTFSLTLLLDKVQDDQETVQLQLLDPIGEVSLGTPQQAILTIADAPWFSSLQFAMPSLSVNESDNKVILLVTRAGSSLGELSVNYATSDGTAQAGKDYTSINGNLTWGEGNRAHQTIEIPVLKDLDNEGNETFSVTLSNPTNGAQLGQASQAIITIVNTSDGGSLQFNTAEYTRDEHEGNIVLEVQRLGGNKDATSVNYTTSDGTAKSGQDYTATNGTLKWENGDHTAKLITIPILSDSVPEDTETLSVILSDPTGNANLGTITTAQVKLTDTQSTTTSLIEFDQENYQVDESQGSIRLTVHRTQSTQGEIQVSYIIEDETAKAYSDYIPQQGVIHWYDGEEEDKQFSVDLLDDLTLEEPKTFKVILSGPTGPAQLGHTQHATVTIEDNDTGTLQFSQPTYQVSENLPEVQITVNRLGNDLGEVSVHYTTLSKTAMVDQDFVAQEGTLKWFTHDNIAKVITIPLIYDMASEGDETFGVLLSEVKGPATLVEPKEAFITITENASQDCQLQGNVVDCFFDNTGGTLQDIRITQRGVVLGGQLLGMVQSQGMIKNVMLGPNTTVYGGRVAGTLQGAASLAIGEKIAMVGDAIFLSNIEIQHILIGRNSSFEGHTTLGTGVRFEDNSTIPYDVDLTPVLGKYSASVLGQTAVLLNDDVLQRSAIGGILGAMNSLYALKTSGIILTQDPLWGYLKTEVEGTRYSVLPLQVKQVFYKLQAEEQVREGILTTSGDQIIFVTHTGREITTSPVIQAPEAFRSALSQMGFSEVVMQENGNIMIPTSQGNYLIAHPSLYSRPVPQETALGLTVPTGETFASFVFDDEAGHRHQQFLYPAPADSLEEQLVWHEGVLSGQIGQRVYHGQLDYWVTLGSRSAEKVLQIIDIEDVNKDGLKDYQIVYPGGSSQLLFAR